MQAYDAGILYVGKFTSSIALQAELLANNCTSDGELL